MYVAYICRRTCGRGRGRAGGRVARSPGQFIAHCLSPALQRQLLRVRATGFPLPQTLFLIDGYQTYELSEELVPNSEAIRTVGELIPNSEATAFGGTTIKPGTT